VNPKETTTLLQLQALEARLIIFQLKKQRSPATGSVDGVETKEEEEEPVTGMWKEEEERRADEKTKIR